MENSNQNPEQSKEKEYEEIQNRATKEGHLENIDTHVSSDIESIVNYPKRSKRQDNSNPKEERER